MSLTAPMQRLTLLLLSVLALGIESAAADQEASKPAPAKPQSVEQVVEALQAAVQAGDDATVEALAARETPDRWLIVDELCHRAHHDAAARFAKSAPTAVADRLRAYVASQRGRPADDAEREALAEMRKAVAANQWPRAFELAESHATKFDSVVRLCIGLGRGLALRGLRKFVESTKALEAVGEAATHIGWHVLAGRAFHEAGFSAHFAADPSAAIAAWQEGLRIRRAIGDARGIAEVLTVLGLAQEDGRNFRAALAMHQEALQIRRRLGDQPGLADTLYSLGNLQLILGSHAEALQSYEASLAIFRKLGDARGISLMLHRAGFVHEGRAEYSQALARYEASLDIARKAGSADGVSRATLSLGNVQQKLGNYEGAIRRYETSLKLNRAAGNRAAVANALDNIGVAYQRLGELTEALQSHEAALEIRRELGSQPDIASTLNNMGNVKESLKSYDDALKHYEAGMKILRALDDQARIPMMLGNIGRVQALMGKPDAALMTFQDSLKRMEASPDLHALAKLCSALARLHLAMDRPDEALRFAQRSISHVTSFAAGLAEVEGAGARDVFADAFDIAYQAATRSGQPARLAKVMEDGRAGSLRESLGARGALEAAVIPNALHESLATARRAERVARVAYAKARQSGRRSEMRSARGAWSEAQTALLRVSKRIEREAKRAASVTLSEPDDLERIQSYLEASDALVYYALTKGVGVALVVRRDGARVVPLSSSRDILGAVDAVLGASSPESNLASAIPSLRMLLSGPLRLAPDVKRVLVSPMGRLGYLPFSLVFAGKEVAYVPSGTTLGLLRAEDTQSGDHVDHVLALGDPDYGSISESSREAHRGGLELAPLPATRPEVQAIGTTQLLSKEASESGLLRALMHRTRWRSVHFACHGLVNPEQPMLSALALSADQHNDGFLTALEIFGMKVPSDLVVLSACDTAKGRIYKTEGIAGLTRAFMFAGAPRVICSLWKVDDEATMALMTKFYELWKPSDGSEGLGVAAALQQAQAFIRSQEKWRHPYYWAAWVLWGLPN